MSRGKREAGYTWTCLGSAAHPALQPLFLPLCRTGKANPGPRLFLLSAIRLDPGYRNAKWSTNTELALSPNEFFFSPFPYWRERGKKKKKSFTWLPFLDLQQIPLNFKNNASRCWRMQTGNWRLYTKVKNVCFFLGGGWTMDKEGLYLDSESSWQLRT